MGAMFSACAGRDSCPGYRCCLLGGCPLPCGDTAAGHSGMAAAIFHRPQVFAVSSCVDNVFPSAVGARAALMLKQQLRCSVDMLQAPRALEKQSGVTHMFLSATFLLFLLEGSSSFMRESVNLLS